MILNVWSDVDEDSETLKDNSAFHFYLEIYTEETKKKKKNYSVPYCQK